VHEKKNVAIRSLEIHISATLVFELFFLWAVLSLAKKTTHLYCVMNSQVSGKSHQETAAFQVKYKRKDLKSCVSLQ